MDMWIRQRGSADVDALCELVVAVHAADGYPVVLQPNVREFIVTTNCRRAWVAEIDGHIAGHVSLHTVWSDEVAQIATAELGVVHEALASVSRLFVSPTARGLGVGRALLETATAEARSRSLHPVLDVVTTYPAAITLYESSGWVRPGTIDLPMPTGAPIAEHVYAYQG